MTVEINLYKNDFNMTWTLRVYANYWEVKKAQTFDVKAMGANVEMVLVKFDESVTFTDELLASNDHGGLWLMEDAVKKNWGKYYPVVAEWNRVCYALATQAGLDTSGLVKTPKYIIGNWVESDLYSNWAPKTKKVEPNWQVLNDKVSFSPTQEDPNSLSALARLLPGVDEIVKYPCDCEGYKNQAIRNVIIHLNDSHKWTRDKIADWLETLDVDLTFKNGDSNEQD